MMDEAPASVALESVVSRRRVGEGNCLPPEDRLPAPGAPTRCESSSVKRLPLRGVPVELPFDSEAAMAALGLDQGPA